MNPDNDSSGNNTSCVRWSAARSSRPSILARFSCTCPGFESTAATATRTQSSMVSQPVFARRRVSQRFEVVDQVGPLLGRQLAGAGNLLGAVQPGQQFVERVRLAVV